LLVRQPSEPVEVEIRAREPDHVLGLAAREPERDEFWVLRPCNSLACGELVRELGPLAVALDEAVANREGGEEGDLLGRDRRDETLARIRRERGTGTRAE